VDINLSKARCTIENSRIRLGFRYVKDVGEKAWLKIEEARKKGPFTSLKDFHHRAKLDREAIESLILVGAFDYLGVPKRQLLWELGILVHQAHDMLELDFPIYPIPLPAMSLMEEIAADYMVQGMSARHHPMEVFRTSISKDGVLKSSEIASLPSDAKVRVAGCVVCRQRPITAKGVVFVTIEDEEGMVNVILWPQIYAKYRRIARMEPLIVVEGILQKRDGIINVVAEHLLPLKYEQERQSSTYQAPAPKARNFA
jgi:error-prone DNA polymerase